MAFYKERGGCCRDEQCLFPSIFQIGSAIMKTVGDSLKSQFT
jgi:hypothetical protein